MNNSEPTTSTERQPIEVWLDFASPYAYFAMRQLKRLAIASGRQLIWRPVILWAVLKAQGIPAPSASTAKWSYLLRDMKRSAEFYGLPFVQPKFPLSAHLAARMFYGITRKRPEISDALVSAILDAHMGEGAMITNKEVLSKIAYQLDIARADAFESIDGPEGRALLEAAVKEGIEQGVIGSPFIILDGEPFFGADRLPQLEWRIASSKKQFQ